MQLIEEDIDLSSTSAAVAGVAAAKTNSVFHSSTSKVWRSNIPKIHSVHSIQTHTYGEGDGRTDGHWLH